MTRVDLVNRMAPAAGLSKAAADRALRAMVASIRGSLKRGEAVTLVGFGTFAPTQRKARQGRNPRTGETIKIKASRGAKFSAGKELKTSLNK